jgi:hypothetical protein
MTTKIKANLPVFVAKVLEATKARLRNKHKGFRQNVGSQSSDREI